ncbi:MAG: prepilin-type N-terminal cleavage/methylation domain-containing protein [Opitutaceae bacterium]|nr:prepilin-type N-terminal cleavage/methylation domain-containing protein [Opitutaceae bacterium]
MLFSFRSDFSALLSLPSLVFPVNTPTPPLRPAGNRSGFTLIELLTVIGIIGILAAIIIPVVGSVRNKARQSQCGSNLRQLYTAAILYANDNRGRLPVDRDNWANDGLRWHRLIYSYAGGNSAVTWPGSIAPLYVCPSDPAPFNGRLSYGINEFLDELSLTTLQARVIMFSESSNYLLFNEYATTTPLVKYNHSDRAQAVRVDGSLYVSSTFPSQAGDRLLWLPAP